MAEIKLPRLLAAAKEFNVGQDTIIDFLKGKGFSKDDLKPTSKLTEEMYRSLQLEFQTDKAAKIKSDQLELPKGAIIETKKKKEEEEIIFKKEDKAPLKIIKKEEQEKPDVDEKPTKEKAKKEELFKKTAEITKPDVPEIEGPKVLKKIDLSAIDSSTRPKKEVKAKKDQAEEKAKTAKEEKPVKVKPKKETKEKKEKTKAAEEEVIAKEEPVIEEQQKVIENIEVKKLTGPKILGKIDLPVDSDTRPVKDEKRKRKRIPIEKKDIKRDLFINKEGDKKPGGGISRDNRNRPSISRRDNRYGRREEKLIDEKEIQEKIRETQAKLAGAGGRSKGLKAKLRREKRNEAADAMGEMVEDNKLKVTEFISVSELANLLDVSFADVISKCMGLGIMVSINQRLDAEVIELVAGEFGYTVEFIDMEKQMEMEEGEEDDDEEDLQPRSPIVTIMGHVDHGKTSLLDYIRSANVVAGEAGGITQHIGAYQVQLSDGKEITFLDTPGHEAFTAMRARGAKVTDIAVIVIAADDAVMPQTREAISHAQAAGVPMIFAINKIDKDGANTQKIYEQLSQMNLLVEEWGGKYQSQEIAAKKGLNIDKLLEKILLEAEILDLKANPVREATGTIIEASLDKGRGYVATLLVENGTLKHSDLV
ncbi:MAG: translation initiation factor IF-2 N-terminal domain-containing protein, partial [Chitinophagaceae bacterium]